MWSAEDLWQTDLCLLAAGHLGLGESIQLMPNEAVRARIRASAGLALLCKHQADCSERPICQVTDHALIVAAASEPHVPLRTCVTVLAAIPIARSATLMAVQAEKVLLKLALVALVHTRRALN
jgi:hypothetical protein